jgi:hypothetical protein
MTGTKFAEYIRKRTKTNTTTLPDADILTWANANKDLLAEMIETNVDERYFELTHTRDLIADQREYSLPQNTLLGMSEIAVKFDGTNFAYPTEIQRGQYENWADEEGIQTSFTGKDPRFIVTGRGFKLLSEDAITAVTDGLRIVANVYPEDLETADLSGSYDLSIPQDPNKTVKHAMPRASHKVWATMCVIDYKQSKEKPIPLTEQEKQIKVMQDEMYSALRQRNEDRSLVASMPEDNGENY